MAKVFPTTCPCCGNEMKGQALHCPNCDTTINGTFDLPLLLKLDSKNQEFITSFVLNSGSLKEMANQMKLSYPTVRNMLDDIIEKIENLKKENNDNKVD